MRSRNKLRMQHQGNTEIEAISVVRFNEHSIFKYLQIIQWKRRKQRKKDSPANSTHRFYMKNDKFSARNYVEKTWEGISLRDGWKNKK